MLQDRDVAAGNPGVDLALLREFEEIRRILVASGAWTDASYGITAPFSRYREGCARDLSRGNPGLSNGGIPGR